MKDKENNQPSIFKNILIVAVVLFAIFAYSDLDKTNDELEEQVSELSDKLVEKEEELEELTYEYEELDDYLDSLRDRYSESHEASNERYLKLYQLYDQLRFEKSIPVYHCEHSEDSIINLLYSFLSECGYLENAVEYSVDDGSVVVPDGLVEIHDEWIRKIEEAVDFDAYLEYEYYLEKSNSVLSPKQFEQQYNAAIEAGVSHSQAIKDISNATIEGGRGQTSNTEILPQDYGSPEAYIAAVRSGEHNNGKGSDQTRYEDWLANHPALEENSANDINHNGSMTKEQWLEQVYNPYWENIR